jgi:3-hydroxyisobutyrate dehydrogenase-like beta-hydroxyacid dehydrogenase
MNDDPVGLIGAGLLGSAVASRWLQAGVRVVAFDSNPARMHDLKHFGAEAASSAREVFARCQRAALVLPDSAVSRQVLEDAGPLSSGSIILDMTTGDPEEMVRLGERCAGEGASYLDVTVGGSSAQVHAGDAIVMAGGDPAAFESCGDLLHCFARRIFYLGACGNGARMKLALNLVLGLNRAVLAEGLAFARACGLSASQALEIFRSGPAHSNVMDIKGDKMLNGDFTPQARLSQHRKDVDLILTQAARHSARTPFSELHRSLLRELESAGYGDADNSAIVRAFETG